MRSETNIEGNGRTRDKAVTRVLWISPNLNHYKKRLLDHLSRHPQIELRVIVGHMATDMGHRHDSQKSHFHIIEAKASKKNFAWHWQSYAMLWKEIMSGRPDTVLFPLEKKLLPLLIWVKILTLFRRVRLISYNHPVMPMRLWKKYGFDKWITKQLFKLYQGIVFYTKNAKEWAVDHKMVPKGRAFFANNTLDTQRISEHANTAPNLNRPFRLLFIGRLIPTKRVDLAIAYFETLQQSYPDIALTIIGDGPLSDIAQEAAQNNQNITWLGAVTEEALIAPAMNQAHGVFIPGETGLSVVHAFAYGKPYFTLDLPSLIHGPELSYLESGKNGLLLSGEQAEDCEHILNLITDETRYKAHCLAAREKADYLSIDNWRDQMVSAIAP